MLGNVGRAADAIRAWERSLELNPNNAAAKAGLGIAQIFQKRHVEAVANIDTALRLSPSDPLLYHWLAHRAFACVPPRLRGGQQADLGATADDS